LTWPQLLLLINIAIFALTRAGTGLRSKKTEKTNNNIEIEPSRLNQCHAGLSTHELAALPVCFGPSSYIGV
jgi:hypothetical protein